MRQRVRETLPRRSQQHHGRKWESPSRGVARSQGGEGGRLSGGVSPKGDLLDEVICPVEVEFTQLRNSMQPEHFHVKVCKLYNCSLGFTAIQCPRLSLLGNLHWRPNWALLRRSLIFRYFILENVWSSSKQKSTIHFGDLCRHVCTRIISSDFSSCFPPLR